MRLRHLSIAGALLILLVAAFLGWDEMQNDDFHAIRAIISRLGSPSVTKSNFDVVQGGMTLAEVEAILGKNHVPGLIGINADNLNSAELWLHESRSGAAIIFHRGKVSRCIWVYPTDKWEIQIAP